MKALRQFLGNGVLTMKGVDHPVAYNITVWGDQNRRRADGTLSAPMDTLETAFRAGGLKLRLQTGEVVEIVVTSVNAGADSSAEIAVNTPMPGF